MSNAFARCSWITFNAANSGFLQEHARGPRREETPLSYFTVQCRGDENGREDQDTLRRLNQRPSHGSQLRRQVRDARA
eukprot:9500057-Pyramimonas_sp.AAC.1